MIYQHYKGGLYYLKGIAVRFNESDVSNSNIKPFVVAKCEESLEDVTVLEIYDKNVKSTYYAHLKEYCMNSLCLYKDTNGQHWLRRTESFYGSVGVDDDFVPRFKVADSEYIFDTILTK